MRTTIHRGARKAGLEVSHLVSSSVALRPSIVLVRWSLSLAWLMHRSSRTSAALLAWDSSAIIRLESCWMDGCAMWEK